LVIGGAPAGWEAIGIAFDAGNCSSLAGTILRIDQQLVPGLHAWSLDGVDVSISTIDGIATVAAQNNGAPDATTTSNDLIHIVGIDHVVINTPDLQRTSDALSEATGVPLKRIRDAGNGVTQGFHKLGSVVVEIVTMPSIVEGPATLWGFVLNVSNLDEIAAHLGPDVLSPPKPAVQPGRRIATFRGAAALGVPVALMGKAN
jgi:hypothetical protein